MPFPRAPKRPVKGTLKLVVRPPETEAVLGEGEEVDPREEFSGTVDSADGLNIKLPQWFSVDKSTDDVTRRQHNAALEQIQGLRDKRSRCAVCKKKTSERALDEAELFVRGALGVVLECCPDPVTFIIGQLPDGAITLDLTRPRVLLSIHFSAAGAEHGAYLNDELQHSDSYRYSVINKLKQELDWFCGA